jgi:hypothetical protein
MLLAKYRAGSGSGVRIPGHFLRIPVRELSISPDSMPEYALSNPAATFSIFSQGFVETLDLSLSVKVLVAENKGAWSILHCSIPLKGEKRI